MAVAAETQTAVPLFEYRLVDSIPDVAEARQEERVRAEDILEHRRHIAQQGAEAAEVIPLPVDALSTAHFVLEAAELYGEDSDEYIGRLKGFHLDCRRLVAEWYRKKKPEHFRPLRHMFDTETEDFFSHGLSTSQMTKNALTPITDNPEEENRRINEKVEDATPQILRRLGQIAIGSEVIRTVSECTDKAISDYAEDIAAGKPHRGYGGYVPEIEKLVVRDIWLDADSNDRLEEQIALPGKYITHFIIQKALESRGADVTHMDKTKLHGSQFLARDDLMEFAALLDTTASQEWCTEIFMGEEVPKGFKKDYAKFRQEALRRQEELKDLSQTVALYVMDLAEDNVDRRLAPAKVEKFLKKLLLDLGKNDFVTAEQMFDEQTAWGLQEVVRLEAAGQYGKAFDLMQRVEKAAPGGGYCGASCGIEDIDIYSAKGKELAKKLKAESGDTLAKDKDRSCTSCKRKGTVSYAYNKNRVNKYCSACDAFESKNSRVSGVTA